MRKIKNKEGGNGNKREKSREEKYRGVYRTLSKKGQAFFQVEEGEDRNTPGTIIAPIAPCLRPWARRGSFVTLTDI